MVKYESIILLIIPILTIFSGCINSDYKDYEVSVNANSEWTARYIYIHPTSEPNTRAGDFYGRGNESFYINKSKNVTAVISTRGYLNETLTAKLIENGKIISNDSGKALVGVSSWYNIDLLSSDFGNQEFEYWLYTSREHIYARFNPPLKKINLLVTNRATGLVDDTDRVYRSMSGILYLQAFEVITNKSDITEDRLYVSYDIRNSGKYYTTFENNLDGKIIECHLVLKNQTTGTVFEINEIGATPGDVKYSDCNYQYNSLSTDCSRDFLLTRLEDAAYTDLYEKIDLDKELWNYKEKINYTQEF